MSLALVHSRAQVGVQAPAVSVETHLANGLPHLTLVGLPETTVKESKDRVRSAIVNSGLNYPQRRITQNLAPADLPKDGGRYDLAIALGILAADGQVPVATLTDIECLGELALSGKLRPVQGVLPAALAAREAGRALVVPRENAEEASLAGGLVVYAVGHLLELVAHLNGQVPLPPFAANGLLLHSRPYPDLSEVQGQVAAKRALLLAASGAHNLLFTGPPGTGKTLLASRLPGLLPPLDEHEALEVAAIQSVSGHKPLDSWPQRPFRHPHHSASGPALVGGSSRPQPGEITLAHHGVLFLDELPEFSRDALESLREPLETGEISVARVREHIRLPADVMLVAAMNPCPCGYFGARHARRACKCPPDRIERYRSKISGPLLDRFDMAIQLEAVGDYSLNDRPTKKESPIIAEQIAAARDTQLNRQSTFNSRLSVTELQQVAVIDADCERLLNQVARQWGWSARAWHRTLRVARTIADLARASTIDRVHISQAIELRRAMDGPSG